MNQTIYHPKRNTALLADARCSLLGHLTAAVSIFLISAAIRIFLNGLPWSFSFQNSSLTLAVGLTGQAVMAVFSSLFNVGLSAFFLNLQYGQKAGIGDLFICFRENQDTSIRVRGFVTVGGLLFLLPLQILLYPGIVPAAPGPLLLFVGIVCLAAFLVWRITFAMVNFLLLDFPEMGARRILRAARSMMRGNRVRYLRLMLRILPLYLLSLLSFGVTTLWTGSYQRAASAAFYRDLLSSAKSAAVPSL